MAGKDVCAPMGFSGSGSTDAEAVVEADDSRSVIFEDPNVKRNATWADVVWHSITAMVGAGVLGLPHAFSYLGWAGGVIFLAFSLWVSWLTYKQLVELHEVPDLDAKGGMRRLDRYDQLADYVLGKPRGRRILLPFQLVMLAGMGVAYTIVGGDSLAAFVNYVSPGPRVGKWVFYVTFGGIQMLLSMLPSMHDVRLVSLLGALMSAAYCTIAVAMAATVRPGPEVNYNPAAVGRSPMESTMGIFNAMTTVFFAYGGHNVALEIQATIPTGGKHPLSTIPAMMRGVNWTFLVTGLCYFGVSIMGFWAFGTNVGDNVLLVFAKSGPHQWVVAMANMFVVVHVAAAYQVYTQPVFSLAELPFKARNGGGDLPLLLQFVLRISYVIFITVVSMVMPFFGAILGFVGAIAITPTTFLLPPLLWNLHKQPPRWGVRWTVNWALVYITGVLGVLGCVGSLYSIVVGWRTFKVFAN